MITSNNVSVVPRKMTSKFGVIKLSYNVLASVLKLPQSFEVVSVSDDTKYNSIMIKFIHPNIKETVEGGEIPAVQPGQLDWQI